LQGRAKVQKISRPKSLTELATERVRNEIISGRFEAGEALSVNLLAEMLGISRTPIREALMHLTREGLVEVIPQKGTLVFDVDRKELADVCDLRAVLEQAALRYAMARDREGLAASLGEIVEKMTAARTAEDVQAYLALDTEFHAALFEHCRNSYLSAAYDLVAGKMAALRNRLGTDAEHMTKSFEGHQRIASAVEQGDLESAATVLQGHIDRKEGSYWSEVTDPELNGRRI